MQTPRPRPGRPPPGPEGGDAAGAAAGLDTPPLRRGSRRHRAWRAPQGGWHRGAQEGVGGGR